jgi:hypothetical protein
MTAASVLIGLPPNTYGGAAGEQKTQPLNTIEHKPPAQGERWVDIHWASQIIVRKLHDQNMTMAGRSGRS